MDRRLGTISNDLQREHEHLLRTVALMGDDDEITRTLLARLNDNLMESLFVEVRLAFERGDLDEAAYARRLKVLTDQCLEAGYLPLAYLEGRASD